MATVGDLPQEQADYIASELMVIHKNAHRKMKEAAVEKDRIIYAAEESYRATLEEIHAQSEKKVRDLYLSLGVDPPAEGAE